MTANATERRDLALTVLELDTDEFYWVIMEALQADSEDCLTYRPIDSGTEGAPDYSQALIQGAAALRQMQGLATFGLPALAVPPRRSRRATDEVGREEPVPTGS